MAKRRARKSRTTKRRKVSRKVAKTSRARPYAGKRKVGTVFKTKGRYRRVVKLANGKRGTRPAKAVKRSRSRR
jgi:hypothetical protein